MAALDPTEGSPDDDRGYGVLLILILALLVAQTVAHEYRGGGLVVGVLVTAVLLVALRSSHVKRPLFRATAIFAAIGLIALVSATIDTSRTLVPDIALVVGVLLAAAPLVVLGRIVRHRVITIETIFGAISVYLLIALVFAFWFSGVHNADGAAFILPEAEPNQTTWTYYSFVTITTLGYGDITPVATMARSLAGIEAVLGQVYLVTIVARFVSLLGTAPPRRAEVR